jgi:RNA polymerase-binding transcription factor DksA
LLSTRWRKEWRLRVDLLHESATNRCKGDDVEEADLVHAEKLADQERDNGIAAARAKLRDKEPDFDGQHCVDCGDEIPQARLDMGRARCVTCQEVKEERSKRGLMAH